jgi:dihydropyrimidinase
VGQVEGFTWATVARVTAENPARIFRLPGKGAIEPGYDADLVVLHPDDVRPVPLVPPYWKVDNGIFEGLPHIPPRTVLQRGRLLARDGRFTGEPAAGRFVAGGL